MLTFIQEVHKITRVYHEAAYDSLLTAQVFIKLSARLHEGGESQPNSSENTAAPTISAGGRSPALRNGKTIRRMNGTRTGFNVLEVEYLEESDEDDEERVKKRLRSDEEEDDDGVESEDGYGELIPPSDSDFWVIYGNKLRVFGTEERMCDLTRAQKSRVEQKV